MKKIKLALHGDIMEKPQDCVGKERGGDGEREKKWGEGGRKQKRLQTEHKMERVKVRQSESEGERRSVKKYAGQFPPSPVYTVIVPTTTQLQFHKRSEDRTKHLNLSRIPET